MSKILSDQGGKYTVPYKGAEAEEIKTINIWDTVYQEYKEYYTKEQINEMTFAELGELIAGLREDYKLNNE